MTYGWVLGWWISTFFEQIWLVSCTLFHGQWRYRPIGECWSLLMNWSTLVMDRITATATAVNRMLVWQPQPRLFFSTTAYILRNFYSRKSLFYLFWSSNCNYVIATYYFFLIVQKRIYGSIYFSSLLYLNFFNT